MKIILKIILLTYMVFSFSGCSSAEIETPKKENTEKPCVDSEDFDDFEEEMRLEEIYDPFISYNRTMTGFNSIFYENIFKPVNSGYQVITTAGIRTSIGKFFNNIYYPMHFLNNIFQGKIDGALIETGRFLINSTVGLLGFFDPAKSQLGLYPHKEDFGQTLGFYGVGAGPHIVIPIFGPSNLRDLVSIIPDAALSPIDYTTRNWWTLTDTYFEFVATKTVEKFNEMSIYSTQYEQLKKDAVDLYPYLRDIYEQRRIKEIEE